jgi:hypothetical protein
MSGPNCDRNRRLILLLIGLSLIVGGVGCATRSTPCTSPEADSVFRVVRSSGGAAVTSAEFRIGARELVYGTGRTRCASLAPSEADVVAAALRTPRLLTILSEISSANYGRMYSDMPHIVLDVTAGRFYQRTRRAGILDVSGLRPVRIINEATASDPPIGIRDPQH